MCCRIEGVRERTCIPCLARALSEELARNVFCVCPLLAKWAILLYLPIHILLFGPLGGLRAKSYICAPGIMPPFLSAPLKKPPDAGTGTALSPAPLRELLRAGRPLEGLAEEGVEDIRLIALLRLVVCHSMVYMIVKQDQSP